MPPPPPPPPHPPTYPFTPMSNNYPLTLPADSNPSPQAVAQQHYPLHDWGQYATSPHQAPVPSYTSPWSDQEEARYRAPFAQQKRNVSGGSYAGSSGMGGRSTSGAGYYAVRAANEGGREQKESVEDVSRREQAARILDSAELLIWFAGNRNESLSQTRAYFESLALALPTPPSSTLWKEEYEVPPSQRMPDSDGEMDIDASTRSPRSPRSRPTKSPGSAAKGSAKGKEKKKKKI